MMADLFTRRASYPDAPGHQDRDTSRDAAQAMRDHQGTIQARVLRALQQRPMASFEIAAATGISYRSVQPRTAELARAGKERPALIHDSGERRQDPETGHRAIVWALIEGRN